MPDTSIHRPVVESYEFSTDFDPDDVASGTWTVIPRTQILGDGYEAPKEEAQTVIGMNQQDLMAMLLLRGVLPFALKANDTWQAVLKTATTQLTPTWIRVKELGKETYKIVGGQFGNIVIWEQQAVPSPAALTMATLRFTAPANESLQAIQDYTPASGS